MKSAIKKTVFALAIALSLNLHAKTELKVSANNDNTVTITLEKAPSETSLTLKDFHGTVMYQGMFDQKTRNLNLKELPNGKYYIFVEDAYKVESSMVVKDARGLKMITSKNDMIFKPSFKVSGKSVRMSMTNPEEKEVYFNVYDPNGIKVASVTGTELVIKKTFDFSKGQNGNYMIETRMGDHTFTKTMSVN